jgi:hypothetical protein
LHPRFPVTERLPNEFDVKVGGERICVTCDTSSDGKLLLGSKETCGFGVLD